MSSTPSPPSHTLPLLVLLLAVPVISLAQKTIPGTEANQDYFARTQALFAFGEKSTSSCGTEVSAIEDCIKSCNRPGLQERSGCCCVAKPSREFFVGIRGGCRYRQQLLNFTTRLLYVSQPVTGQGRYFDEVSCAASKVNTTAGSCACSIKWEASTEDLQLLSPLPSPTPSLTPGLSPSMKPSPSAEPLLAESPDVVMETPAVLETRSPEPSTKPVPIPIPTVSTPTTGPSVPAAASELPPVETLDATDDGMTPDGMSPEPTDPEMSPEGSDAGVAGTGESPTPPGAESPEETPLDDGSVCVDEQHLISAGVPRDHMVHAIGVRQRVLCPRVAGLPCGTPNHKLRRAGRGLSYAQLCQSVECEHSIAVVNSVYSHLWEETVHQDVTLTMYDVSYPESAQIALHSVMRAGRRTMRRVMGLPAGF